MKLGLFSDIHCNLGGLERALQLLDDCDELLCAGDLLYQYRFSGEVLALLREHRVHTIVGNHDKTILYTPSHPLRASPSVDPTELQFLAGLPNSLALELGGTLSAEHGISIAKREFLSLELTPANLAAQRAIKRALDPRNVLNPGKILPGS